MRTKLANGHVGANFSSRSRIPNDQYLSAGANVIHYQCKEDLYNADVMTPLFQIMLTCPVHPFIRMNFELWL